MVSALAVWVYAEVPCFAIRAEGCAASLSLLSLLFL